MDMVRFAEVLKEYELPVENAYEDLSEVGTVLWHNDNLSIKVVCAVNQEPRLMLTTLSPKGDYSYFESELAKFSSSDVGDVVKYVRNNAESLRNSMNLANESIGIEIAGREWDFNKN